MTARTRDTANGSPSIDWAAVEREYGWRAATIAIDHVMGHQWPGSEPFDWDATKAAALQLLQAQR